MEVIIKGEAKEIAALVLAVQERQENSTVNAVLTYLQNQSSQSEPVYQP